jgi:hypothetical protein
MMIKARAGVAPVHAESFGGSACDEVEDLA